MSNQKKDPQLKPTLTVKQIGEDVYGIHGLPKRSRLIRIGADQVLVDDSGFSVISGTNVQAILADIDLTFSGGTFGGGGSGSIRVEDSGSLTATGINILDFGSGLSAQFVGGNEVLVAVDESELTTLSGNLSNEIQFEILALSGVLQPQIDQNALDIAALTGASGYLQSQIDDNASDILSASGYLQSQIDDNALDIAQNESDIITLSGDIDTLSGTLSAEIDADVSAASGVLQAQIDQNESDILLASGTLQSDINDRVLRAGDTMTGDLTILGSLNVSGTTTQLNTEEVLIEDNEITLNSTVTGSPTLDSSLNVNRGTEPDAQLYWNEISDQWTFGISGSLQAIASENYVDSLVAASSGTLQSDINSRVLRAGDTMTGFLTLSADPTLSGHATTKQYVDAEILAASGAAAPDVEDDGSLVVANASLFDFGNGLDVADQGLGEVLITVNEAELTTLSGNLSSEVTTLSGILQPQITQNANDIAAASGNLQSQIDDNSVDIAAASGTLQSQITQNTNDISDLQSDAVLLSGTLQSDIDDRVLRAGDTMTGFLTLHSDPVLSGHAATKQYVDDEISSISGVAGLRPDIEDDNSLVVSGAQTLDFGNGLSVTDLGSDEALIEVNEAELTTLSGNLSAEIDSDVLAASGNLQSQITQNFTDIAENYTDILSVSGLVLTSSGHLQGQIDDNYAEILALSGTHDTDISTLSGVLQSDIDSRVLRAGDTMTGPLILYANPTVSGEATTKEYVDFLINAVSGSSSLAVEDSGSPVASGVTLIDYGLGLSVTDQGSGEVLVSVDESELTTLSGNLSNEIDSDIAAASGTLQSDINDRVLRSGDTMTGDLTVLGNFSVSGTTTQLNTEEVLIEDNEITLNSTVTGTPLLDSSLNVNRGTEPDAQLYWDELEDVWKFGTSGSLLNIASEDYVNAVSGNLQSDIDQNALDISSVSGTFGPQITINAGNISDLQDDVDQNTADIATVSGLTVTNANTILTASGYLQSQVTDNASDIITSSGYLQSQITENANNIVLSSGTLQSQITQNSNDISNNSAEIAALSGSHDADIAALSGALSAEIDSDVAALSGVLQTDINNRVLRAGDTMTGFLTLVGDPTLSGHAATKFYVDQQISTISGGGAAIDIQDDGSTIVSAVETINFGNGLDVTDEGLGEVQVVVNEAELITLSGNLSNEIDADVLALSGVLQPQIDQNANDIADNFSDILTVSGLVSALDAELDTVSGTLQTQITQNTLDIQALSGTHDADIAALSGALSAEIDADVAALSGILSSEIDSDVSAASGVLQVQIDSNDADIVTLSGLIGQNASDILTSSGTLQTQIDNNYAEIIALSGTHDSDISSLSGTLQADINDRVLRAGDTMTGDLIIQGNLTVSGDTTSLNTEELLVEDNNITLNYTVSGTPVLDAYIAVERGTEPQAQLYWDEVADTWLFGTSGSLVEIASSTLVTSASGTLQSQITQNANDIADNYTELLALSGIHDSEFAALSGTLQTDIDTRVLRAGDTMTGFLTLHADPTLSGHAATKQYVDNAIATISGGAAIVTVEDDSVLITSTLSGIDFGNGLSAVDLGGGNVLVEVVESELTTLSGNLSSEIDSDILTLSGVLQPQITQNASNISTASGTLQTQITQNAADIVTASGTLQSGIDQNTANIIALSGTHDSEFLALSGTLQTDIDSRVLRAGDTMTGFLTLFADPTLSGHAANKFYVDSAISGSSTAAAPDIEDSGTPVVSDVSVIDFGSGLQVSDQGGGEVLVSVDEAELTTLSGNLSDEIDADILTLSGILQPQITQNTSDIVTLSGLIDTNTADIALASGTLQTQITQNANDISQNAADILALSGTHDSDIASISGALSAEIDSDVAALSGVLQTDIDSRVLRAGDTMTGDLTIQGNLIVSGTTTQLNTEEVLIEDNNITLNYTVSGTPILDSYFEVERGTEPNAQLYWDEVADVWLFGTSGSLTEISSVSYVNSVSGNLQSQITQNASDIATNASNITIASGTLQSQITQNANDIADNYSDILALSGAHDADIAALSGALSAEIDADITVLSGILQPQIIQNTLDIIALSGTHDSDIISLSGALSAEIDADVTTASGVLQSQIDNKVERSGDTMTGFLTLHADPVLSGHASTKQYVDQNIAAVSGAASPDIEDSGTPIVSDVSVIDFGSGLTVSDQGSQQVLVSVDESELTTLSGNLSAEIDADVATASGTLQSQITQNTNDISSNDSDIVTLSGLIDDNASDIITASGTLQTDIDSRVLRAGDTMTGFLTLDADPVNALHAATKQYVDAEVAAAVISGGGLNVIAEDDDSAVASGVSTFDFGNGLDVVDEGSGEIQITVNQAELTTLSGNLSSEIDSDITTLSGVLQPQITTNTDDISELRQILQVDMTISGNLLTAGTRPLELSTEFQVGSNYTAASGGTITIADPGNYKISWGLTAHQTGSASPNRGRNLEATLRQNGSDVPPTRSTCFTDVATDQQFGSLYGEYYITTTGTNETVSIYTEDLSNNSTVGVVYELQNGYVKVERA